MLRFKILRIILAFNQKFKTLYLGLWWRLWVGWEQSYRNLLVMYKSHVQEDSSTYHIYSLYHCWRSLTCEFINWSVINFIQEKINPVIRLHSLWHICLYLSFISILSSLTYFHIHTIFPVLFSYPSYLPWPIFISILLPWPIFISILSSPSYLHIHPIFPVLFSYPSCLPLPFFISILSFLTYLHIHPIFPVLFSYPSYLPRPFFISILSSPSFFHIHPIFPVLFSYPYYLPWPIFISILSSPSYFHIHPIFPVLFSYPSYLPQSPSFFHIHPIFPDLSSYPSYLPCPIFISLLIPPTYFHIFPLVPSYTSYPCSYSFHPPSPFYQLFVFLRLPIISFFFKTSKYQILGHDIVLILNYLKFFNVRSLILSIKYSLNILMYAVWLCVLSIV